MERYSVVDRVALRDVHWEISLFQAASLKQQTVPPFRLKASENLFHFKSELQKKQLLKTIFTKVKLFADENENYFQKNVSKTRRERRRRIKYIFQIFYKVRELRLYDEIFLQNLLKTIDI